MWRLLKGSDQPHGVHYVRALNDPARINGLAVLRRAPDAAVSAVRCTLETWRSLAAPGGVFIVAAATEPVEGSFFSPADLAEPFQLDLTKKQQAKWDRVMANLHSVQGLRIDSNRGMISNCVLSLCWHRRPSHKRSRIASVGGPRNNR
jgi:hypothetical protein